MNTETETEQSIGTVLGEKLRQEHQKMMKDAQRFRALQRAIKYNRGIRAIENVCAQYFYGYDGPYDLLADLADMIIDDEVATKT